MKKSLSLSEIFEEESYKSSYHKKHKQMMISYLIESWDLEVDLAWMIIELHQCSDMSQTLNLFIKDDDEFYNHLFIPQNFILSKAQKSGSQKMEQLIQNIANEEQTQKIEENIESEKVQKTKTGDDQNCRICGESINSHNKFLVEKSPQEILNFQFNKYLQANSKTKSSRFSSSVTNSEEGSYKIDPILSQKYSEQFPIKNQIQNAVCCQICYGDVSNDQIVKINGVSHEICLFCMHQYLKQEILNRRVQSIGCPHCSEGLKSEFIKSLVSNIVYEKYEYFLRSAQIQKNPDLLWCPNPKCSIVINSKNKKKGKVVCPKCSMEICPKCIREYHPKMSCNSVFQKEIKDFQNAKDIQKCRKCKAIVEKISGCNHMTCTVCRYQWCWLCGSTFSYVHFSPLNPLGCAGLQNRDHSNLNKWKIYGFRFLIFIAMIALSPIIIPLVMICCGPALLIVFMSQKCCRRSNCCVKFMLAILLIPIGLAVDPLVWIGSIIYFIPKICSQICDWFEKRRYIHNTSENILRRRLIEEQEEIVDAV